VSDAAHGPWWRLHEPTTTLTDWAITLVAGSLAVRLVARSGAAAPRLLAAALVAVALTALVGGAVHGAGPRLGEPRKRLLWLLTLQLAGLSNALLLAAAIVAHAPAGWRTPLLTLAAAKLLLFARTAWRGGEFRTVVLDTLVALAGIAALEGAAWLLHDARSAPWILGGVLVSLVGGGVQRAGLALHRHFNHNDLYHVVQLVAIWLFYRGGLLLPAA
jgi:hypothetical protein